MDWVVTLGGKAARGEKYPAWISQARREYYGAAGIYESLDMIGVKSDLGNVVVKMMIPAIILNSEIPKDARIVLARRNLEELALDQYSHRDFVGASSVEDMLQFNEKWYARFEEWASGREVFVADFAAGDEAEKSAAVAEFVKGGAAVADTRNNLR
jgi:hypothetical protein